MPILLEGIAVVEGEPSGDGRMFEHGALNWDGVLPIALVFDPEDSDHTGMTVGSVYGMERRDNGVVWVQAMLSDTNNAETQDAITRVMELLDEGAVGVSLRWDSVEGEIRVKREIMERQIAEFQQMMSSDGSPTLDGYEANGDRLIVAKFAADDALEVTTKARPRHLAIVDTAAWAQAKIGRATTGAIAAAGMIDRWSGNEHFFDDPKFGRVGEDDRLRYDPERDLWSCPNTVDLETGRVFGHITPMGICLRGRPDRCINPPDGDLEGFMRGHAPAAGGRRTGVISCGAGSSHCEVGIGIMEATQFYDRVGYGVADVRVGNDQYGTWYAGMIRPGTDPNDIYRFAASDVSGHWEYPLNGVKHRATLVGLPAVSVGGFPKGYMTYEDVRAGLAAAGGITIDEGCGSWTSDHEVLDVHALTEEVQRIGFAVGEMYAAHLLARDYDSA